MRLLESLRSALLPVPAPLQRIEHLSGVELRVGPNYVKDVMTPCVGKEGPHIYVFHFKGANGGPRIARVHHEAPWALVYGTYRADISYTEARTHTLFNAVVRSFHTHELIAADTQDYPEFYDEFDLDDLKREGASLERRHPAIPQLAMVPYDEPFTSDPQNAWA